MNRAKSPITLPRNVRRLPLAERREVLAAALGCELPPGLTGDAETAAVADLLIENVVGTFPVPLGLATGFRVDGEDLVIPLATEEASVVAAASYAARLLADSNESGGRGLGIRTEADPPIGTVQLFLEEARDDAEAAVGSAGEEIAAVVDGAVATLVHRGGGFRGLTVSRLPAALKVEIDLDVRDAMGANKVNTAGEAARPLLERLTGGRLLMAIVSNASRRALVRASGQVPCARLARAGYSGAEVAQRIVRATAIAAADHDRAVTHNKGVLNGIAALTLATGNDTRAVEAAAHGWAASGAGLRCGFRGRYRRGDLRRRLSHRRWQGHRVRHGRQRRRRLSPRRRHRHRVRHGQARRHRHGRRQPEASQAPEPAARATHRSPAITWRTVFCTRAWSVRCPSVRWAAPSTCIR